jgi:RNA polymerase sigma-B factor
MSCETVPPTADRRCLRTAQSAWSAAATDATDGRCFCVECLVLEHLSLARSLALRYRNRGVDDDDLVQVARLGLVLAARRFDQARGDFVSFAVPTITGEIRRHFRDSTWDVRVPRRIQELIRTIRECADDATRELGHSPSDEELARRAGVTWADIQDARRGAGAYRRQSLDEPGLGGNPALADVLPDPDDPFEAVDNLESLVPAVRDLDERDARILYLRFYRDLTQAQIAEHIGVSQMHVSRLLFRILSQLRNQITPGTDMPAAWSAPCRDAEATGLRIATSETAGRAGVPILALKQDADQSTVA